MKKYVFTQKDVEFVQNLFNDEIKVFLKDDNTAIQISYNIKSKYISSCYINFSHEFIEEIRNHFKKIGEVTFNNTYDIFRIYY